ncbi:GNAT family N-acetyltransferase [Pseudomonas sp. NPDC089996]|uniref:GNAT family N-acetyltransferase n=1 Tax=Pseudomonas sp. NPDC089996 TaxID=3364474 RepID=UPI0037F9D29F
MEMTFRLRPATVVDLPAIYRGEELYIRTWEPDHEAQWRLNLERHLTRWVENFDRLTVAVVDDDVAGYALWGPEDDFAELCTVSVQQDHRRAGIGMALVQAYMRDAAWQGFTKLRLSVRPDNPAKLMYERAGFSCTGTGANGYLTYERQVGGRT